MSQILCTSGDRVIFLGASVYLHLLLLDRLEGVLLLVLEHTRPGRLLDHAEDLGGLHVENLRDATLVATSKSRTHK